MRKYSEYKGEAEVSRARIAVEPAYKVVIGDCHHYLTKEEIELLVRQMIALLKLTVPERVPSEKVKMPTADDLSKLCEGRGWVKVGEKMFFDPSYGLWRVRKVKGRMRIMKAVPLKTMEEVASLLSGGRDPKEVVRESGRSSMTVYCTKKAMDLGLMGIPRPALPKPAVEKKAKEKPPPSIEKALGNLEREEIL